MPAMSRHRVAAFDCLWVILLGSIAGLYAAGANKQLYEYSAR